MNRLLTAILSCLLGSAILCQPAHATYTANYIFGDSLSDTGNFNLLTGGALQPPYVNGRFSNGPVYSEIVSAALGLSSTPSFAGGTNYAVGGARTDSHFIPALSSLASLQGQVGMYLGSHPLADSQALYTVYIGSNDLFDAVSAAAIDFNTAMGITMNAASILTQSLQALAGAGAHTFVVPTVTDLGLTPAVPGPAKPVATALASTFNSLVDASLVDLEHSYSGLRIIRPDIFGLLQETANDPATFGLSNVTTPCYDGFVMQPGNSVCPNPEQYLFWDIMHPTAVGHQFIADTVLDAIRLADASAAVPEPHSLALLLMALAVLVTLNGQRKLSVLRSIARRRPVHA